MAPTSQSATAKKLGDQADAEPSMEEILASIRQIISEDETPDDGLTERERYTHPTDPSNLNFPLPNSELSDHDLAAGNTSARPSLQVPSEERAAKVRAELAARHESSPPRSGINALRDSGVKLKTEALAEKFEREMRQPQAVEVAPPPVLAAAPPIPRYVPATQPAAVPAASAPNVVIEQMASTMMREKSAEIDVMLGEMMRPIVRKWLGDNLPMLVERLVREEIERVSRGRQAS